MVKHRMQRLFPMAASLVVLAVSAQGPVSHAAESGHQPPESRSFDPTAMDPTANACENFYQYACGGWHKNSPRPASKVYWSRSWTEFRERLDAYLRDEVEAAAKAEAVERSGDQRRVGDFYAACMDTDTIEERGDAPLRAELALINGMQSKRELPAVIGALIRDSVPGSYWTGLRNGMLVGVYGGAIDGWKTKRLGIGPGESLDPLNLPAREMYLDTDEASVVRRARYREHIATMLELTGQPAAAARRDARQVLEMETALAGAMPSPADLDDLSRMLNPRDAASLAKDYPDFDWQALLRHLSATQVDSVNLDWPPFMAQWNELARDRPLPAWQAYLRFHLVTDRARFLPEAYRKASFAFFGAELDGATEEAPRWQTCMSETRRYLPDPVSRMLLERGDRPKVNAQLQTMFEELRAAMHERIEAAEWLSPSSRRASHAKLDAMRLAVSHPSEWLDDPRLVIRADDYYGNGRRASEALRRRALDRLGEPVLLDEWGLPPIWVGGFYSSGLNAVYMTAAQLLFFAGEDGQDLAGLYGNLGSFVGHEMSHGFDPMGAQFDGDGRLRPWWSDEDREHFEQRTQCVADTFSALTYPTGDRLKGASVVTEQTAELTGTRLALAAYRRATADHPEGVRDGLTADQRFYVSSAQSICLDASPEVWRQLVDTDPHAFGPPGVNGTLQNMPGFAEAFGCKAGESMMRPRERMCDVW